MIKALSYVVVMTPHLDDWCELAARLVGLQVEVVEAGVSVRLRMDNKKQRLLLEATAGDASLAMGFEVADQAALDEVSDEVSRNGFSVQRATAQETKLRGVSAMVHFQDPDGNRVEIAWGLQDASVDFVPGRPMGGFRTGDLGMGHVALKAGNFQKMCALYRDVLHFRLSDRASVPFVAEFYHVNQRHHTIGLADTGTGAGVYHLMLEYNQWDDVGRAYDMALEHPESIGVSLGRHSNDHVTSFYVVTPDGWMIELGWAARLISPDWETTELPGMSLWGHDRTWLPEPKREEARQILKTLAANGIRADVVLPNNG